MYPLVTIMIPTYKQGRYLHRAIEGALAQDYNNLEVIVSDDCSPDHTPRVVEKYKNDPRFSYFRNDTDLGRVRNYKRLLESYASGDWVIMCDGDDFYEDPQLINSYSIVNTTVW